MLNHKERVFHSEAGQGAAILADLEFHLRRGELPEAWEYDRELRATAKAYGVKRYRGVQCSHAGHGRLRHVATAVCCDCVKERSKERVARLKEEREQRVAATR